MTQEEKELLLKDLCARLPYGVKINYNGLTDYTLTNTLMVSHFYELMKPYLRPTSSMTEEEIDIYRTLKWTKLEHEVVDWLNKNMFDYRGLIEKGLALEAPEGMYNV